MNTKYFVNVFYFALFVAITSCARTPLPTLVASPTIIQYFTSSKTNSTSTRTINPTATNTINACINGIKSPNGKYIASIKFDNRNILIEGIVICDITGTIIWTIPSQLEKPTGNPHPNIDIYRWSRDSAYLYFRYYYLPDGGDFSFFWDGYDLQTINILSGNIQKVLPINGFVSFSLSPDDSEIAYLSEQEMPYSIHIRILSSGIEKRKMIDQNITNIDIQGNIIWYSDGKQLVFQLQTSTFWIYTFFLNVETMQLIKVNDYKIYTLFLEGWTDDGKLKFFNYDNNYNKKEIFIIDPKTGVTLKVTPTSTNSIIEWIYSPQQCAAPDLAPPSHYSCPSKTEGQLAFPAS